jgi:hypothetical protein
LTDPGAARAAVGRGLTGRRISSLAINPKNPATVYAGSDSYDLFKSTDGGGNWVAARKGLPEFSLKGKD